MKKNANFPILIVVLVLVAVVAQITRHSGEKPEWTAMRQDMVSGLALLWEIPQQQVDLVAGKSGVVVQARVNLPPGTRARKQRWNYPFLRFVAQRHPKVAIEQLEVSDASTQQKISEIALNGLLAEAYYPPPSDEERNCLMVSRQFTTLLDGTLGRPGECLVLVDATPISSQRQSPRYGKRARLEVRPTETLHYEICVVTRSSFPPEKWEKVSFNSLHSSQSLRRVTLP